MQDNNKQKTSFMNSIAHNIPIFTFMNGNTSWAIKWSTPTPDSNSTYPRQSTEFYGFLLKPHQSSFCPVLLSLSTDPLRKSLVHN